MLSTQIQARGSRGERGRQRERKTEREEDRERERERELTHRGPPPRGAGDQRAHVDRR